MDQRGFVRKSIVRISFKWPNPDNKGKILTVVLPGTIVSIKDDGSCVVLADRTFFRRENCPFVVNLPTSEGYDAVPVAPSMQFFVRGFCVLVLQVQPNGYLQPVTFETGPVRREEEVYGFLFPQEDFFTPTMYCPGNVIGGESPLGNWVHDIPFHSFGRFGSPIFNQSGHLVGISYQNMDALSVKFLQLAVLSEAEISSVLGSVSYVLNGNPIPPEVPILPEGPVLSV
ncbi:hypothetical protein CFC21_063973 [Triticum aestivum]|uniref:Uncharacterized protein n=3 Tax=Triticum TaxID=4564 RepID=A0A9R0TEY1_TRITD|nr:uncharacterized protein LOC123106386 [Triticum aestivum]KAF7056576.1 hypothetical protein CFC21_063973 [Triticum aestivum]VAI12458.1 unnamed protein product [Triticum turgidum subsp. durum]